MSPKADVSEWLSVDALVEEMNLGDVLHAPSPWCAWCGEPEVGPLVVGPLIVAGEVALLVATR
jgi:hypothetical protein